MVCSRESSYNGINEQPEEGASHGTGGHLLVGGDLRSWDGVSVLILHGSLDEGFVDGEVDAVAPEFSEEGDGLTFEDAFDAMGV